MSVEFEGTLVKWGTSGMNLKAGDNIRILLRDNNMICVQKVK